MKNNEITGGLKNAVERGDSLERAVQSFINAGYNAGLVRQAAEEISSGVTSIVNTDSSDSVVRPSVPLIQPKSEKKELEGTAKKVVVGLVITFVILIALLIFAILFGDKIISLFS